MQKRYSDLLADILEKKYSNCTCPTYLSSLKTDKPKWNIGECQFGPNCQFSTICNYNQEKCTCYPQCTCSLEVQRLISAKDMDVTDIPPKDTYPNQKVQCTEPNCICVGTCLCKSDDSLLGKRKYQPPSHCNTANCICSICLCRPDSVGQSFLPTYFRDTIINEAKLIGEKTTFLTETKLKTDKMIERECAEIKQLLVEHEENKKKELAQSRPPTVDEKEPKKILVRKSDEKDAKKIIIQKTVSINEESRDAHKTIDSQTKSERKSTSQQCRVSLPRSHGSIIKPQSVRKCSKSENKQRERGRRKEKTSKRKLRKHVRSPRTKLKTPYSRKASVKMRPLRIRYYYSGDTEHYGVKLGHRQCVEKKGLVPKNMGWLWNIEDPTKGIRERKGWPPGFIGKSIKNMIKCKKRMEELDPALGDKQVEVRDRWKPGKVKVEEPVEPKEELPLLHIVKKGRTYNITFCPKDSDEDVGPIPIPFTITEKKRDSDSESSDSTLEFELHSPKPRRKPNIKQVVQTEEPIIEPQPIDVSTTAPTTTAPPSIMKLPKKKPKKKSIGSEENKILWEEQQTQIQKIA